MDSDEWLGDLRGGKTSDNHQSENRTKNRFHAKLNRANRAPDARRALLER